MNVTFVSYNYIPIPFVMYVTITNWSGGVAIDNIIVVVEPIGPEIFFIILHFDID